MLTKNSFLVAVLTTCILLIFIYPVFAEPIPDTKSQTIDLIIEKTGIKGQLAAMPSFFDGDKDRKIEQFFQQHNIEESEQSKQIKTITHNNLSVENLAAEIRQTLAKQYNENYAREVLNFYNSDLGAKIARCEIAVFGQFFTETMEGFDIENYDNKRRGIINRLFNNMKALQFNNALLSVLLECSLRRFNATLPKGTRTSDADIIQLTKKIKEFSRAIDSGDNDRKYLIAHYYITYENITNDELVQYDKFVKSKSGKWLSNCIQTGMISGLKNCTDKLVNDLTAYIDSQPQMKNEEIETVELPDDI